MTPRQIQIELRERGLTQKAMAEKIGVSEMSVSLVIHGRTISRRIMDALSRAIEKDIKEVFPEYFGIEPSRQSKAA